MEGTHLIMELRMLHTYHMNISISISKHIVNLCNVRVSISTTERSIFLFLMFLLMSCDGSHKCELGKKSVSIT